MPRKPATKWAQRKDRLYITCEITQPSDVSVAFSPSSCELRGNGSDGEAFELKLSFLHTIDPAQSSFKVIGNSVQVFVMKKESAPYWERLTIESSKHTKQWLTCDWKFWVDEDEEDSATKEPVNFGGYGDLSAMKQRESSSDGESDEDQPPADITDLDK